MDAHERFAPFLGEVETALEAQVGGAEVADSDILTFAARHLVLGSGKRARPLLVRIFADALEVESPGVLDAAVAAELIHAASLLHDDVVDLGMFRRGRPTVNARWVNTVAVMSGDLLLSGALLRLSRAGAPLVTTALQTISEMTRAAIVEVEARGKLELPLEQLKAISEGKTGSLFGWCGVAVSQLKGDPDARTHFDKFGRGLGVAFQMADDIRDVTGTDEGKSPFADIRSRTPSLPVLLAARKDPAVKKRLTDAWGFAALTPERGRELGALVVESGVIDEAMKMMEAEISRAVEALGPYARTPSGERLVVWAQTLARGIALRKAA